MVALWGCSLNVFVFIIVFLLVRSLREWVCHLQRWQLLIVVSNEAKFDFQPALMRMNIHWRVRGSLVRNGWWIPHYPIWTTWPPNQLSYSSFPFLPNATNKVTHKQMTTTHPITSFGRPDHSTKEKFLKFPLFFRHVFVLVVPTLIFYFERGDVISWSGHRATFFAARLGGWPAHPGLEVANSSLSLFTPPILPLSFPIDAQRQRQAVLFSRLAIPSQPQSNPLIGCSVQNHSMVIWNGPRQTKPGTRYNQVQPGLHKLWPASQELVRIFSIF